MNSPYKRRRPGLIRNLWIYRRLVVLAILLGLMLWFVAANNTQVTVFFPLRLGQMTSTSGVIMLLSALAGSLLTALTIALVLTIRKHKQTLPREPVGESSTRPEDSDDRPPPDYASKTTEGFSDARWSGE